MDKEECCTCRAWVTVAERLQKKRDAACLLSEVAETEVARRFEVGSLLSRGQERGWKTSFLPHSFSSSASTMLLPLEARHRFIIIIHQTAVAWAVLVIMMMDRW